MLCFCSSMSGSSSRKTPKLEWPKHLWASWLTCGWLAWMLGSAVTADLSISSWPFHPAKVPHSMAAGYEEKRPYNELSKRTRRALHAFFWPRPRNNETQLPLQSLGYLLVRVIAKSPWKKGMWDGRVLWQHLWKIEPVIIWRSENQQCQISVSNRDHWAKATQNWGTPYGDIFQVGQSCNSLPVIFSTLFSICGLPLENFHIGMASYILKSRTNVMVIYIIGHG